MFKFSVSEITNFIEDLLSETCKSELSPIVSERDVLHK